MAARCRQHQGFAVGQVTIGTRGGGRQSKHLALKRRLVHFGHQRSQGVVVHRAQHRAGAVVAHQQVFAECLDDAGQAGGAEPQFTRAVQLLEHLEFRAAHVAVGDEDDCLWNQSKSNERWLS